MATYYSTTKIINSWSVLIVTIVVVTLFGASQCLNPAQEKCQSMYSNIPVSEAGTAFLNNNCQISCNFTGNRNVVRDINDGQICPPGALSTGSGPKFVCRSGRCVPESEPTQSIGRLTILSSKAELVTNNDLDTYLMICVLNNHPVESIPKLPLSDWDWQNRCHSCASDVVEKSTNPYWVSPCPMSERYPVAKNSRIVFEVWTYNGRNSERFLGGAHVKLEELIKHSKLGHELILPLAMGPVPGRLITQIDWN